jgi:hypothetical protein
MFSPQRRKGRKVFARFVLHLHKPGCPKYTFVAGQHKRSVAGGTMIPLILSRSKKNGKA